MIKTALYLILAGLVTASIWSHSSFALDGIIRPYQSIRSSAMGGTRTMTGLYDDNFFGNPARVTRNPTWRIDIFNFLLESTTDTITEVSNIISSDSDLLSQIGNTAGENLHGKIQTSFPAGYFSIGRNYFALGMFSSTQFDIDLRKTFQIDPTFVTDIGPAFTFGRFFFPDERRLSVGFTLHMTYRLTSKSNFTFVDLLQGDSISPSQSGGDGAHIDMGIGSTWTLPFQPADFKLEVGFSINNLFGGRYQNLGVSILNNGAPRKQFRAANFGFSASRQQLWIFDNFIGSLEFNDIGNNDDGSLFKLVHIGAETWFGILAMRVGINQGYWSAGLGVDLEFFEVDLATYGEEMSLNAGELEDRRIVLKFGFKV